MLENLSRDDFAKHLGPGFQIWISPTEKVELELVEVTEGRERPPQETYSLVFLAPAATPPIAQIYRLEHDQLGEFEIFLSPFEADDNRVKFEASFSRLI